MDRVKKKPYKISDVWVSFMYYLNIQSWETVYFWGNADFPKGEPKHTEAQVAFKVNFILAPEVDSWFPNT